MLVNNFKSRFTYGTVPPDMLVRRRIDAVQMRFRYDVCVFCVYIQMTTSPHFTVSPITIAFFTQSPSVLSIPAWSRSDPTHAFPVIGCTFINLGLTPRSSICRTGTLTAGMGSTRASRSSTWGRSKMRIRTSTQSGTRMQATLAAACPVACNFCACSVFELPLPQLKTLDNIPYTIQEQGKKVTPTPQKIIILSTTWSTRDW